MFESIVFVVCSAFLVWRGFFAGAGFATWHMFTTTRRVLFDLEASRPGGPWRPFNPWDLLPHSGVAMDRRGAEVFLAYLRAFHDLELRGTITVIENERRETLLVNAAGLHPPADERV